ncbi:hypothetical protein EJB05_23262 [Eragrostis curvula]|uniref:Serine/threonine-protein kinase BSK1-like TPR repeats domain-containing protein n=1 Tax=Eragrostis curvula TaxID=38414 RepID=A0A5J9V5U2_9POAL|nr:hypothetical protein EJB05_23262 [Eragrostis curvula]
MRGLRGGARRATAAPFVYCPTSVDGDSEEALLKAALDGDLGRVKGIIRNLGHGSGDKAAVFSLNKKFGYGVMHRAAGAGHLEVCKYLVEELGGDPNMTAEGGACKVTEYLLSKGIPVDIDCGFGTPLHQAVVNEQDKTAKILLDHQANAGADVDGKGALMSPLLFATEQGGYTDYVRLLLKAGANPNIPDIDQRHAEGRKAIIKSLANGAFRRKDYNSALEAYNLVIGLAPEATLYSNRSLCKLKMGDGEGALSDAYQCRMMRPDWAKACYRQAAAHMLLKEYKQAYDALLDAQKLEPGNDEIEKELRKAMELMKISPDKDMHEGLRVRFHKAI